MILRRIFHNLKRGKGPEKRLLHFLLRGHWFRKYWIKQRLDGRSEWKLQIGGGYHDKKGWINGDLIAGDIYLNASKRLPFEDNSMDIIFAEQFIEHLDFSKGFHFLKESYRILKRTGKLRLATPDLNSLIALYYDRNPDVSLATAMERHKKNHNRTLTTPCHFLNDFFRLWGHSFIYDESTLRQQLINSGFINIKRQKFCFSDDKRLKNLERHADTEWMKDAFQLILEAEKN